MIPANAANAGTHRKGGERMRTKTVYRLAAFIVSLAMAAVFLVGCTDTQQDAVTVYETDTLKIERQGAETRIYDLVGDSEYTFTTHRTRVNKDAAQNVQEARISTATDTITISTVYNIIIVTTADGKTLYVR